MNKFYLTLAGCAVAAAAMAATPALPQKELKGQPSETAKNAQIAKRNAPAAPSHLSVIPEKELKGEMQPSKVKPGNGMMVKSMRKADSANSIEGTWVFDLGDYYFQTSVGPITYTFEATLDGNQVVFEDPTDQELPFVAEFNASAGTLTFNREYLGSTGSYYVYQEPFVYNYNTQDLDLQTIVGNYNASAGTITFKPDNGISWPAYTNQAGTNMAGYFGIYDLEGATKKSGGSTGSDTSIEGTWIFDLGDYYFQTSVGPITYEFVATLDGNEVWFEDPTDQELPFVAEFNASAGTLTFNREYLGSTGSYYVYQEPFVYNYNTQDLDPQTIVGNYNASAGTITFKPDNGISWPAYTNQAGTNMAGYFGIYDLEGATKQGGGGNTGGDNDWTDLGNATFMDGWVLPLFGIDQTDEENWYEVPLQQSNSNPNVYRLVNPYKYGPAAEINQSTVSEGYIEFDVTDPDHVVFHKAVNGFAYADAGITTMYSYNMLAVFMNVNNATANEVITAMGNRIPYTTFKDGVLTLSYVNSTDGIMYDANFGYQGDPNGGYSWQDNAGRPVDMSAMIIFPKSTASDGSGTMTTQLDMNMGMGDEPDLLDPQTFEVTAEYDEEARALTINGFADLNPITFTILDLETGEAQAANQIAEVEDLGEDGSFEYYYSDVASQQPVVYATIESYGEGKTIVKVNPWGEGMDFEGFGYFFITAYYNTEVILNLSIPGLGEAPVPSLELANVSWTQIENEQGGFYVEISGEVISENIPEETEITVCYTDPVFDETRSTTVGEDGKFSFTLGSLNYNQSYATVIFAQAGNVSSEAVTIDFRTSGIATIGDNEENVRYFNLQGAEVSNPERGSILIKVAGSKAEKVVVR